MTKIAKKIKNNESETVNAYDRVSTAQKILTHTSYLVVVYYNKMFYFNYKINFKKQPFNY